MRATRYRSKNPINWRAILIALLFVMLFCAGLFAVFYYSGVFQSSKIEHTVTYIVEASGGKARMSYTMQNGEMSESTVVSTPWKLTLKFNTGDEVYLVAGNPSKIGDLSCEIRLDNNVWQRQQVVFPEDKVACAGFVGSYSGN